MTDEEIKQARAIIDAANQVRPKSDRIEIAGFEVDENDEIVATSNLFVDVALSEWPRALDEIEALKYIIRMCKNCDGNARAAELEQERDQLKSRIAELEAEVARLKQVVALNGLDQEQQWSARILAERDHQRKRAEAWKEAALRLNECAEELSDEPGYDCPAQDTYDRAWDGADKALDRARAIEGEE